MSESGEFLKIKENIEILKCPVCGDSMYHDGVRSLICLNKHCFDISKRGYVNLLLNSGKSKYDKEMFQSRNAICNIGFFDPLIDAIVLIINKSINNIKSNCQKVLDAGCGEGFHLARIMNKLHRRAGGDFLGVGIDISKEGIQIAAKNYKDIIWCVADLARLPFMNTQFDVILNILSPANYGEFERIICHEGILIKVVPDSDYLKELRTAFYQETDKEIYSNKMVIEHFSRNFDIIDTQKVKYNLSLSNEELNHLIKMTPLSWGVSDEKVQKVLDKSIDGVTIDFTVIVGKRKL